MSDLTTRVNRLYKQVSKAAERLDISALAKQSDELKTQIAAPGFWDDSESAAKIAKKQSDIENIIQPWQKLKSTVKDLAQLAKMDDASLEPDIEKQLSLATERFEEMKQELRFSGKYDRLGAVMTLQAGAGGTDAMDWVEMLLRMYSRWAQTHDFSVSELHSSAGDEAGLKSVTIKVEGQKAYGLLKGEHGVHRLVRLSPFNTGNTRETSFAMVEVVPDLDTPDEIEIDESELKIDVFRASGHGGQSVNTTDSAVRITHLPTGVSVSIQNERSQQQNKAQALKILKSKLAQLAEEQHEATLSKLKGPNEQAAWGNQIRSYVLHPYTLVKDSRTKYEEHDAQAVLDGKLDGFIDAYHELHAASDLENKHPDRS